MMYMYFFIYIYVRLDAYVRNIKILHKYLPTVQYCIYNIRLSFGFDLVKPLHLMPLVPKYHSNDALLFSYCVIYF